MQYTRRKEESKLNIHTIAFVLLSAFIILKVYRGFSGVDSSSSGGVWNIIQILFVIMGTAFVFFDSATIFLNRPIVALFLFSTFALVFAIPYLSSGMKVKQYFDFTMIPFAVMLMIVLFEVGKHHGVKKNLIMVVSYYVAAVILVSAMMKFYNNGANLEDKGAVADVYYILGLLPLILAYTPKKIAIIPVLTASLAVAFSGKRAGLLAIAVMLTIYFFTEISHTDMHIVKRIGLFLVIVAGIVLLVYLLMYLDQAYNMDLFERMEELGEDKGSGRDRLWMRTFNSIREFNIIEILTGRGKGSVRATIGIEAHNDFLHVFHEHGLFALICYVLFYVSMFSELRKMYQNKYPYVHLFFMSLISSLFIAFFSFFIIYPTYNASGMVCAGFFMGDHYKFQVENNLSRSKNYGYYRRR